MVIENDDREEYISRLEKRIELLGSENAAFAVTLNKLMQENMKLKSDLKNLSRKVACVSLNERDPAVQVVRTETKQGRSER
jgi:regulator of replication initiation timing